MTSANPASKAIHFGPTGNWLLYIHRSLAATRAGIAFPLPPDFQRAFLANAPFDPLATMVSMDNGWQESAHAWIADMGDHGDFARRYVLDPVMLPRALARSPRKALDIGCGEGRFCRMLKRHDVDVIGMDSAPLLITAARARDADGAYLEAEAERLPFCDEAFDLVVSYLSLIDIPNIEVAIPEMVRVLSPGGSLLIANLNSFNTACAGAGWIKDSAGRRLHYPIDNYLQQRSMWIEYRGIRVINHHRPLSTYLRALLDAGLRLTYFDEPSPSSDAPSSRAAAYRRVPWFLVMEWMKLDTSPLGGLLS